MDSDIIDVVAEWESTPVSDGYAGLHDLADREFTGAVSEGSVWAFVLNGKVVGVFDGGIEAFEDADATAYHAPDPALPLLYAMQAGENETRAKYYSNDTPLSSADATLSSGNFTGYIELSENVLSGDYYVVYYGGKSMSVAYVGNNRKLLAGDEAFERANDEVGIYHVKEASVDIVEIPPVPDTPEPTESPEQDDTAATSTVVADADTPESENETADEHETDESAERDELGERGEHGEHDDHHESDPTDGEPTAAATPGASTTAAVDHEGDEAVESPVDDRPATDVSEKPRADADHAEPVSTADSADSAADVPETDETTTEPVPDAAPAEGEAVEASDEPEPVERMDATEVAETPAPSPQERAGAQPGSSADASEQATSAAASADVFSEEAEWREATSIPALDPKNSQESQKSQKRQNPGQHTSTDTDSTDRSRPNASESASASSGQNAVRQQRRRQPPQRHRETDQSESSETSGGPQRADVARLEQRLRATAEQKQALETAQERLTAERDEYREEVDRLQTRVSELESEVDRLEGELQETRSGSAAATSTPSQTMSADTALDGTNLFVRYGTKSGGTLEKAHAGESGREEVNQNLRLEHHTGFETEGLAVDGEAYETFLHGSIEYSFVRWVVEDLLYEIRETGNQGNLDELFDAIPKVDRAELHGDVTLKYTEDGEEHREQQSFDVVLRDRMGNPLIVANLNGSRDPATEGMMTSLVENTSRLRESNESLGAAFLVTASYFDPGALETAADATGGGLLSRGRRKSFVKLSRKQGFHLCLVETRNGDFHLNVPEL
ncbi:hypothetical protein SAMN04487950_2475 [Halogranum rubrum]|uniref:DUF7527 domain-containing protein n=1 Tax=Halogranum rubrum TaxID=553466 RepID=A0A1I4EZ89_9EURY|nr:hypothetical protein [Halogranum rubrum]SFL10523.1 hypothetical protein SAMN04487950_2475 [Halogranum rubrum]